MNRILFFLKQLVLVPYNWVAAPMGASNDVFKGSSRGRAMIFGLPALLMAVFGGSIVLWASYGNADRLESKYNIEATKIREEKNEVMAELNLEIAKKRAEGVASDADSEEKTELRYEFERLQNAELIYLNKLISLNPKNRDYRFRLALATLQQNTAETTSRSIALMRSIAPETEPGYAKAHLWLAQWYLSRKPLTAELRNAASQHLDRCLIRDSENQLALEQKAKLLRRKQQNDEAYKIYEKLFKVDPHYYVRLHEINVVMGGQEVRQKTLLDSAQFEFQELIRRMDSETSELNWSSNWRYLVDVLVKKDDYQLAEDLLSRELENINEGPSVQQTAKSASRALVMKQLLVAVYNSWAAGLYEDEDVETVSDEVIDHQLELLKKAIGYAPNHPNTLVMIARVAMAKRSESEKAKELYDPDTDEDAPAKVDNLRGNLALQEKRFEDAIKYFERAREKLPNDSTILNNLAYAYLVCEDSRPDRALKMIDSAIRTLPLVASAAQKAKLQSHFHDTRGHALLQMNRLGAAIASFEIALDERPNKEDILKALVQCYTKLGNDDQAAIYQRRLDTVIQAEESLESERSPNGKSD